MMILLLNRQPTGKRDDTGADWKRMPAAGSYDASLATERSAVLPAAGAINGINHERLYCRQWKHCAGGFPPAQHSAAELLQEVHHV